MNWQHMQSSHISAVISIAEIVHPNFPERPEVLREKLALFGDGAFILEHDGISVGYLFCHPWAANDIPELDMFLQNIPNDANVLYLHDIALLPAAQGQGAAAHAIQIVEELARASHFNQISLCAVNGSTPFWRHHLFEQVDVPNLHSKLMSYDKNACFMVRQLRDA